MQAAGKEIPLLWLPRFRSHTNVCVPEESPDGLVRRRTATSSEHTTMASETAPSTTTFVLEPDLKVGPKLSPCGDGALRAAWAEKGQVEAHSPAPEGQVDVFTSHNLFASAVHKAFYDHYPLILTPEVIWVTIAQGLANHVEQNPETLRSKFVQFEGKEEIVISRPEFVKGSSDNDWPGVFPEFEVCACCPRPRSCSPTLTHDRPRSRSARCPAPRSCWPATSRAPPPPSASPASSL